MRLLAAAVLWAVVAGAVWASGFDDGKDAYAKQDWKGAVTALGRFLQVSPDDPSAPAAAFLRGVALYQIADYRGSLDAFQKLERTWPRSAYADRIAYWKGAAALAAGQATVAERESAAQARFPTAEPFTTRALLNLGLARLSLGKADEALQALEAFTKASSEAPLLAQAWALWGDEDRKAGRAEAALDHYRRAETTAPGGPWDLWARTQALDLLGQQGRWAEALALLDASAAAFPAETARWDPRRIAVARGLGDRPALALALETRWGRASDPAEKQALAQNRARAAEEAGEDPTLWWTRAAQGPDPALAQAAVLRQAWGSEKAGRWAEAAQTLSAWAGARTGLAPGLRDEVLTRAASDYLQAPDPARARKVLDGLITGSPKADRLATWLLDRGRLALAAGDGTQALVDFTRLLKERPQAPEAPEARYQTGLVYLQRQEPVRAEAWFYGLVQDLKTGDLYQRALLARGVSFVDSGQTDLARGSLQRLIREAPQGPWAGEAWSALGRNALRARAFAEAAEAYAQAQTFLADPGARAAALWSQAEALAAAQDSAGAAEAWGRYAEVPDRPRASEALYRRGALRASAQDWQGALDQWSSDLPRMTGPFLAQTREALATALLRLNRPEEAWAQLEALEASQPDPEAWYRWGQTATTLGRAEWALKAFQTLLLKHPQSPAAEAALPRAAGTLLEGGQADEALARYGDYFRRFGRQSAAAPVARAAAAAAQAYPAVLEALVKASAGWNLGPEVAAEFALAWAQSRLDSDTPAAQAELEGLSRTAPWTSQRSEALGILGRWNLGRGQTAEARKDLEAAAVLGDDLSVFRARWALAQVTEKEGDVVSAARQREAVEKAAGPGVPREFRLQVLREAAATWTRAGKADEAQRVAARIAQLAP